MRLRLSGEQQVSRATRRARSVDKPDGAASEVMELQRLAGNQAVVSALRPRSDVAQRACCGSCSSGGTCEREEQEGATHDTAQRGVGTRLDLQRATSTAAASSPMAVQRYYTEDCEDFDATQRRNGVGIATDLAARSISALNTYITAKPSGTADPRTARLLRECFTSDTVWTATNVRAGFRRIKNYLDADDFTIECEDDCTSANAYVYGIWTDVHMCMNVVKNYSARRFGEILLHEVSHDADNTDDEEYFYPPAGSRTTLSLSDALDNADSFEAFAAQI